MTLWWLVPLAGLCVGLIGSGLMHLCDVRRRRRERADGLAQMRAWINAIHRNGLTREDQEWVRAQRYLAEQKR